MNRKLTCGGRRVTLINMHNFFFFTQFVSWLLFELLFHFYPAFLFCFFSLWFCAFCFSTPACLAVSVFHLYFGSEASCCVTVSWHRRGQPVWPWWHDRLDFLLLELLDATNHLQKLVIRNGKWYENKEEWIIKAAESCWAPSPNFISSGHSCRYETSVNISH